MLHSLALFVALSCLPRTFASALPPADAFAPEAAVLGARDVCNADNCLRAVRATAREPAIASSFCLSYITSAKVVTVTDRTTSSVTPATPTITSLTGTTTTTIGIQCTVTTTSTTTPVVSVAPKKRTVATTPFAVSISSACPSANHIAQTSRISSACSCFLGTSTVHVTSTVTSTLSTPKPVTITTSFLSTATTSTCSSYTTSTVTVTATACSPNPTIANGQFQSGSFSPWVLTEIDSTGNITAPIVADSDVGSLVANIALTGNSDSSFKLTTTVTGLCGAGTQFRVLLDYFCQFTAATAGTEIRAYIDGGIQYADSCDAPVWLNGQSVVYGTALSDTAVLDVLISWEFGSQPTAPAWQIGNVYAVNGFGF